MSEHQIPEVNQREFSEVIAENQNATLETIRELKRLIKDYAAKLNVDLKEKDFGITTNSTFLRAMNDKVNDLIRLNGQIKEEALPTIGLKLEEEEEKRITCKFAEPRRIGDIRAEIEQREAEERAKKAKEEEERRRKEEEKMNQLKKANLPPPFRNGHPVHPSEYYRSLTQFFSVWDETGFPVCDDEGNQISDERMEEIMKEWRELELTYNKWRITYKPPEFEEATPEEFEMYEA